MEEEEEEECSLHRDEEAMAAGPQQEATDGEAEAAPHERQVLGRGVPTSSSTAHEGETRGEVAMERAAMERPSWRHLQASLLHGHHDSPISTQSVYQRYV